MDAVVVSVKDPRIALARSLRTRADRQSSARCLVEGRTLIEQVLVAGATLVCVLRAESATGGADDALGGQLNAAGVVTHRVGDGVLRQVVGSAKPVPWLGVAVLAPEASPTQPWGGFAVVCDGVADPGNLGTLARSASALGVEDLVLTDPDTDVSSRRVVDTSRGAVLSLRTRRYSDPAAAIAALRAAGFQIVATSPRGRQLQGLAELDGRPVALIVGGETSGVSAQSLASADLLVAIPMVGAVESLNVGVAAGIGIYELTMKRVLSVIQDKIRATVGRDVAVAGRFIRDALDQAMQASAGLSGTQVIGLMVVAAERRSPLPDLATDLGVADPATVLAPLVDRGWLTSDGDELVITPAGEQGLAALWPVQERVERQLLDGLDDDERLQLSRLLRTVQTNAMSLIAAAPSDRTD